MRLLSFLLPLLLLTGCAAHQPLSEMLMFREKETQDGQTYQARYSHALVGYTIDYYPTKKLEKAGQKHFSKSHEPQRTETITTHAILLSDKINTFALSLAVGSVIGIDGTIRLANNTYLTGLVDFGETPQSQLIIQQRLYDGNPVGLSVGASYSSNYLVYEDTGDSGCPLCLNYDGFNTPSVGLRSVVMYSEQSPEKIGLPFLYLTGSINYDFTVKTLYPKMGFAIGIY